MFERYHEIREAQARGDEAGFTLIELLIVIVVLGILAAVVIFGLSGVTGQSAQAACNADAKSVEIAAEAYHTTHGTWPANAAALTAPDAGNNNVRYLRTFPNNPKHYLITIDAAGNVTVEPHDGNGAVVAGTANYDTTPNPCSLVS